MPGKHPKDFSVDEVGLWLVAIGMGDKVEHFREEGVDGGLLVTVTQEDFDDLGLSSLQGKKLLRNLETSKAFAEEGGADRIHELEHEIEKLHAEIERLKVSNHPPAPAPAPPPQKQQEHHHHHHHQQEHQVIRGAAGGAAKGAVLGAVAGAIAGDPAQGAKMGAAVGGTAGGMRGLGARRQARMYGR